MKKRFVVSTVAGLMAVLMSIPVYAALRVGATAPDFSIQASLDGEAFTFSLEQALAKGPVVVYFFPAAFTKGCDIEAHTFSVNMDKFEAAGATVIGISADSIERLNAFSADPDFCAGAFPVASDPHGRVAAMFGLEMMPAQPGVYGVRGEQITHGFLPRVTFVLDSQGTVVARLSSEDDNLTPVQHVTRSLAIVRQLQAKQDH